MIRTSGRNGANGEEEAQELQQKHGAHVEGQVDRGLRRLWSTTSSTGIRHGEVERLHLAWACGHLDVCVERVDRERSE